MSNTQPHTQQQPPAADLKAIADMMHNSWTATAELNNGQLIIIWWTCWPSVRSSIKRLLDISSDYPKRKIEKGKSKI